MKRHIALLLILASSSMSTYAFWPNVTQPVITPQVNPPQIDKNLSEFYNSNVTTETKGFVALLSSTVPLTDLLSGAHIVIQDRGDLYLKMKTLPGAYERTALSSHYRDLKPPLPPEYADQYGIDIDHLGHVLFGVRPSRINPKEYESWLQFEAHGVTLMTLPRHALDYIRHKLLGVQVGPHGTSPHSEKYPENITDKQHNPAGGYYGSELIISPQ